MCYKIKIVAIKLRSISVFYFIAAFILGLLLHIKPHHKTFMAEKYKQVVMFYVYSRNIKRATKPHVTLTVSLSRNISMNMLLERAGNGSLSTVCPNTQCALHNVPL